VHVAAVIYSAIGFAPDPGASCSDVGEACGRGRRVSRVSFLVS